MRRLVGLVGILGLAALFCTLPGTSGAADEATPVGGGDIGSTPANTHTNASLGYVVTWDDSWTVVEDSTAPEKDLLVLTNGTSSVTFRGRAVATDLNRCLGELIADFANNPVMVRVTTAVDTNGNILHGSNGSGVFEVLTYAYAPERGATDYAVYLECRFIPESGTQLQIAHASPLADYNDQIATRKTLLEGIQPIGPTATGFTREVDLKDILFDPTELTIPAGTDVTINLVNKGAGPHTFDIDALNIHSGEVAPGATKSITVNAAPGDYEYYCAIPGHKEAGMVGTLHVVAGAGAAASSTASQTASGSTAVQTIELADIKFQPNALTIPANTDVTIDLVNKGAAPHTFDIDALNIHTGEIAPGATQRMTINVGPGSYEYYCAIPGHKQAGMVGTLVVQ